MCSVLICTAEKKSLFIVRANVHNGLSISQMVMLLVSSFNDPSHEETNNLGLRPCPTQISLYSHKSRIEA